LNRRKSYQKASTLQSMKEEEREVAKGLWVDEFKQNLLGSNVPLSNKAETTNSHHSQISEGYGAPSSFLSCNLNRKGSYQNVGKASSKNYVEVGSVNDENGGRFGRNYKQKENFSENGIDAKENSEAFARKMKTEIKMLKEKLRASKSEIRKLKLKIVKIEKENAIELRLREEETESLKLQLCEAKDEARSMRNQTEERASVIYGQSSDKKNEVKKKVKAIVPDERIDWQKVAENVNELLESLGPSHELHVSKVGTAYMKRFRTFLNIGGMKIKQCTLSGAFGPAVKFSSENNSIHLSVEKSQMSESSSERSNGE